MKKILITLSIIFHLTLGLLAQAPPSPPANAGSGGGPVGGGAPVDGGILILALLAAGYGVKKLHQDTSEA